jgi:hypothetical protein
MALERHVIAQAFQTFNQSPSGIFRLQSIKEVGSGVAVGFLTLDHVVGHDQDRVGHGENRPLLATATGQPFIPSTQIDEAWS